jgi:hypothetical protein
VIPSVTTPLHGKTFSTRLFCAVLRRFAGGRQRGKSSLNVIVPASSVISGLGFAYSTVTATIRVSDQSSIFVAGFRLCSQTYAVRYLIIDWNITMPLTTPRTVFQIRYTNPDLTMSGIMGTLDKEDMKRLMNAGWVITTSWIDNPPRIPLQLGVVTVLSVTFRMGSTHERLTATVNIDVTMPSDVVANVDVDKPGLTNKLMPSTMNDPWLVRLVSIADFVTASSEARA